MTFSLFPVVYVPVFFGFVTYQKHFTSTITAEMRAFPKQKVTTIIILIRLCLSLIVQFFIMGALDALSGIFMTFGGAHTSGSLQALLLQCLIPVTMVLAYIFLHERYHLPLSSLPLSNLLGMFSSDTRGINTAVPFSFWWVSSFLFYHRPHRQLQDLCPATFLGGTSYFSAVSSLRRHQQFSKKSHSKRSIPTPSFCIMNIHTHTS